MATIKNTRDIGLQSRGVNYRIMKPSINLASYSTSPAGYSYFSKPANSATLVPASLTILVTDSFSPGNYSVPVYNWEYSTSADPATYISLGVNTLGLTITNTNFATYAGTGNSVNFRLTVSQAGWTTSTQVYVVDYYRTLAITPVVSLSRSDIILPVSTVGVINYTGTGTSIRVSINNINIPYDVAGTAGPNTFTVTAVGSTTPNTVTVGAATTTTTTVANDTRTFADISGLSATVNAGNIVYTITVRDADGTVSVFTRTQSVVVSLSGATGTNGVNSATVNLYNKNTTTTAPAAFSGTFTYTFATGILSGGTLNGWTQTPPAIAAGEFLFISLATASSITATDSITAAEFSVAQTISGVGVDGANTAVVTLFNKNTSAVTPPTTFSGTFTYTFATAVLSAGTLNGWSQSAPSLSTGEYLWVRQATAFAIATTDTILSTEFSAAVINAVAGTNGTNGATGATGAVGNSAVICYAIYAGNPTVTGAAVTIAGTGLPLSTSFSPTSATAFSYAVQTPGSAQAMFQSNGIYYPPPVNETIWQTPYLSNLKVGSLEALSANMGSLTSGTITGALIRTAASGKRVEIDHATNSMKIYNAGGGVHIETGGSLATLYINSEAQNFPAASVIISTNLAPAIYGVNSTATKSFPSTAGVWGKGTVAANGVYGQAVTGNGVEGEATTGNGVVGIASSTGNGVVGTATSGNGVVGTATSGKAIQGTATSGWGVLGTATATGGVGVFGVASIGGGTNHGVRGVNQGGNGGTATSGIVGTAAGFDFYADGVGNYGPFTGAHDVLVPVTASIATGYIVCDVELVVAKNISNTVFEVAVSTFANQVPVGVMVLNNGLLANTQPAAFVERVDWIEIDGNMQITTVMRPEYEAVKDLYNYCAANAVGEGQVYVCGESGNLAAGDLIVTSSVAGVGMKQSDNIVRNITVAKARQPITFTDLTTPVLVACIYLCG